MILRAVPLDFNRNSGYSVPRDPQLHKLAVEFAEKNLVQQPNLADDYARVWLAVEYDEAEKPVAVQGMIGYRMTPDVTLFRFKTPKAFSRLYHRLNDFFADNGLRGLDALVYVKLDEDPRQKCPDIDGSLKAVKALPANRWAVEIK